MSISTSSDDPPGDGTRVLVVEDDEDIREVLADVLEMNGCDVETAENGRVALQRLRTNPVPPSLILLDLMMPVMDGWQFRAEQRRDPHLAEIPVVVLTAHAPAREAAAQLDAAAVLRKPVDLSDLLRTVATWKASEPPAAG